MTLRKLFVMKGNTFFTNTDTVSTQSKHLVYLSTK